MIMNLHNETFASSAYNLPVVVVGSVKGVVGTSVVVAASLTHSIVHSAPMSFFFLLLLNLTVMSPA